MIIYLYFAISTQVLKFPEISLLYLVDRTSSMDGAYTDYCLLDYIALPSAFTTCCNSIINDRHLPSQLGPSALAGFSLFVVLAPLQERMMAQQFRIRKKTMKHTDQRAKTLLEVLGREWQLSLLIQNNPK